MHRVQHLDPLVRATPLDYSGREGGERKGEIRFSGIEAVSCSVGRRLVTVLFQLELRNRRLALIRVDIKRRAVRLSFE